MINIVDSIVIFLFVAPCLTNHSDSKRISVGYLSPKVNSKQYFTSFFLNSFFFVETEKKLSSVYYIVHYFYCILVSNVRI